MTSDIDLLKYALLAEWQYLCNDDFDEELDMDEDAYWTYLNENTPEWIHRMWEEDSNGRTPELVIELYGCYLSPKYRDPASKYVGRIDT